MASRVNSSSGRRSDRSRARASSKRKARPKTPTAKKKGGRRKAKAKRKPPPDAPPSEFDTWLASLSPRERRIDEVIQMMNLGLWFGRNSHRMLAKKWGVHPGTVEHIAAEASRQIKLQFRYDKDPEARREALARTIQSFEAIEQRGLMSETVAGLRVALEARELFGRYVGIEPPKTLRMKQVDELDGLSNEELDIVSREGIVALRRFQNEKAGGGKG